MMLEKSKDKLLHLALPKGRMQKGVLKLLEEAGINVTLAGREYRPQISVCGFEVKILKPQNIIKMLHHGSRDIGFAGADWIAELGVEVTELLDTGLDPVRLVAAAPKALMENGSLPKRQLVVASEYESLTRQWIKEKQMEATFVRSYGATEVFPPEDADCIVDNTQTGATLDANGLEIVDELMRSSTRLYANPRVLEIPEKRNAIEDFSVLIRSVIEARKRVMLELNVTNDKLESVVDILPCMREPTIAPLHSDAGYAIRAAVLRKALPTLLPEIKKRGGTDLVITELSQIVP